MFAKSLIIFVGVGVISGLVFGLYLQDINDTELMFVEGPSLSVISSSVEFVSGEEIELRIVNSGNSPILFNDASYGLEITGLAGVVIFSPQSRPELSILDPGEWVVLYWDQIKNDGTRALDGLYKITVRGSEDTGDIVLGSTTVTIR